MKILVVGLGSMGKRRIRNLQSLGVTEIAGYDRRNDRGEETHDRFGIQTLETWAGACEWQADAWIVSTPPLTHAAIALEGLALGRHVFTEADLPDALITAVIAKRDYTGLIAVPSCTMVHHPGPMKIRSLLSEEAIGKPLLFTYHTGQHLADWHPWEHYSEFYVGQHATGAAREIVPFELVWLTRQFGPVSHVAALHDRIGGLDVDIDDHYALALRFASGVSGTLLIDVLSRPEVRAMRISGDNGILEWDHGDRQIRVRRANMTDWVQFDLEHGTIESGYINPEEPYIAEMADFIAAVRGERPYPYCFEDDEEVQGILSRAESIDAKVFAK